jgi:hypothetical protein
VEPLGCWPEEFLTSPQAQARPDAPDFDPYRKWLTDGTVERVISYTELAT